LAVLAEHTWPGNVRELANVIEHALILCDAMPIRPEHLPQRFHTCQRPAVSMIRTSDTLNLRDLETQAIQEALDRHNGNKSKAADELGISLKTLYNKLNQASLLSQTA
jgi:two-component system NtrC family response regulator